MQKTFWEEYHRASSRPSASHEWFLGPQQCVEVLLQGTLQEICKSKPWRTQERKALNLGCGTSSLGLELAREPLCVAAELHVVNVDFSPIAIEAMRQIQNSDIGTMRNQWLVADIRDMPFQSSSFDLVIDKGTFDAFEASPIRSPDQGTHASDADGVASLFKEVNRVLKVSADAAWLQFTHTAPELRLEVLSRVAQREAWHIGYKSLGEDENGFEYFVYFLRRRPKFELVRAERDQVAAQVGLFVEEAEASAARACLSGATHVDEERYVVRPLL